MKLNNDQLHLHLQVLIAGPGIGLDGKTTSMESVKKAVKYIQNLISGKPYTVEYKNSRSDDFFGEGTAYKQDAIKLALQRAVELGEVDFVKTYLKASKNVGSMGYDTSVFEPISDLKNLLSVAVQCGQVKVLKILLEDLKSRSIALTLQDRQDLLGSVSDKNQDKILQALGYGNKPTTLRREAVTVGGVDSKVKSSGLGGIASLHKPTEPILLLKPGISELPALMHESLVQNRENVSDYSNDSGSDDVFFRSRKSIEGSKASDFSKTNPGDAERHSPIMKTAHKK